MRLIQVFIFMCVVPVSLACGPYEGPILDPNVPKRLPSCPNPAGEDRAGLSYEAMLSALAQNDWAVATQDVASKTIDARKCKDTFRAKGDPLKRPQDKCLDVHFEVSVSGAVAVTNPQEKRFYWKIQPDVNEWMTDLERDFSEVRCYTASQLSVWQQAKK